MSKRGYLYDFRKVVFGAGGIPKRNYVITILLWVGIGVMEGAGIGLLLPVLTHVEQGGLTTEIQSDSSVTNLSVKILQFAGLEPTLVLLLVMASVPLFVRQGFQYQKSVYSARLELDLESSLRRRIIDSCFHANLPFFLKNNQGEVVSSLLFDVTRARSIGRAILDTIGNTALLLIYVVLAMLISPSIMTMVLLLIGLVGLIATTQWRRTHMYGATLSHESKIFARTVSESFQAIQFIKMRGADAKAASQLKLMVNHLSDLQCQLQRVRAGLEGVIQTILVFGIFAILFVAISQLGMRLANLSMILFITMRAFPLVSQINNNRLIVAGTMGSLNRIDALATEAAASREVGAGNLVPEALKDRIEFRDVSYSYGHADRLPNAIDSVTFEVKRGEVVALVGASGAGKTTVANLLTRFCVPSSGSIVFDGTPIDRFELTAWRRRIAYVTQESILFHDTVKNNICYGLGHVVPDTTIWRILEMSHAAEFVRSLPEGLDTMVGERGMRLSGGQRQRLAIARALIQEPDILLLDESTSALDSVSEAEIQASLEGLRGQITLIVIAHRLSTIRSADKIIILDRGRMVATGAHDRLLDECDEYRILVGGQRL